MPDIYSGSVYVQIKSPCKKRFPSPLNTSQITAHILQYKDFQEDSSDLKL